MLPRVSECIDDSCRGDHILDLPVRAGADVLNELSVRMHGRCCTQEVLMNRSDERLGFFEFGGGLAGFEGGGDGETALDVRTDGWRLVLRECAG
jgi:hypothetical protein